MAIMKALSEEARTPTETSKQLHIDSAQVTRSLKELETINLVRCLTPNLKKGRLYGLTEEGKVVLAQL
jgi:predicted transcriptional regulator